MKCKYCGYEDHSFARVCPICGEAVEEQTVGVRTVGIKTGEAKNADTRAAEPPQPSRETKEIKESREGKAEEAEEEKTIFLTPCAFICRQRTSVPVRLLS